MTFSPQSVSPASTELLFSQLRQSPSCSHSAPHTQTFSLGAPLFKPTQISTERDKKATALSTRRIRTYFTSSPIAYSGTLSESQRSFSCVRKGPPHIWKKGEACLSAAMLRHVLGHPSKAAIRVQNCTAHCAVRRHGLVASSQQVN